MNSKCNRILAEELATQIARVSEVDPRTLEFVQNEVSSAHIEWVAEYGDYQSGRWWTSSLLNESGHSIDVVIRDCEPVVTDLLARLPHTRRLLDGLGLRIMWARLARLAADSFLWEHRDYAELDNVERHRLHIPIATNTSAFLVVHGTRVHLSVGYIWRLTPTFEHGACNLDGPDRVHLIVDCYANSQFRNLCAGANLLDSDIDYLPVPECADIEELLNQAGDLLHSGHRQAAEAHLLRAYYRYELGPGAVYDLLADFYHAAGMTEDAAAWRAKKVILMRR